MQDVQGLVGAPTMTLDFLASTLSADVGFTRNSVGTFIDSAGSMQTAPADIARFSFDPTTLQPEGLLVEETRTNLAVNSLINGANLLTQNVTVTAVPHTLSFYGTGTVVLSGASIATVIGLGAYPARKTITFTPTLGLLTLTVIGTVSFAQLEVGSFATSFIPTGESPVTRAADILTMTGANLTNWFNPTEGTFIVEFAQKATASERAYLAELRSDANNRIEIVGNNASSKVNMSVRNGGSVQADISSANNTSQGAVQKAGFAYKANDFGVNLLNGSVVIDNSGSVPSVNSMRICGSATSSNMELNGNIRRMDYYRTRLPNERIIALTT